MAPYRTNRVLAALPEPLYRSLVWLDVRVAMLFSIGLPLVLLIMGPSGMLLAAGHEWRQRRRQRGSTT